MVPAAIASRARRCAAVLANEFDLRAKLAEFHRHAFVRNATFLQERGVCIVELDDISECHNLLSKNQNRKWNEWKRGFKRLPPMRLMPMSVNLKRPQQKHDYLVVRDEWRASPEVVIQELQNAESLSDQMRLLTKKMRMSNHEFLLYNIYTSSLKQVLYAARPRTTLEPYGSARSGLMSSSSDFDLVLKMGDPRREEWLRRRPGYVAKFATSPDDHLILFKRFIRAIDPMHPLAVVIGGRVPLCIVKHPQLNLTLDIAGTSDSKACDPRPLTNFLAAIVKKNLYKITGHRMSGFKVKMLLIHFLQTRGLMPHFSEPMQRNDERRPQDLGDLLCDFFAYFSDLNGKHGILEICLLSGRMDVIKEKNSRVILREPFTEDFNIMSSVNKRAWAVFLDMCTQAFHKLQESEKAARRNDKNWGVLSALSDEQLKGIRNGTLSVNEFKFDDIVKKEHESVTVKTEC